MAGIGNNWYVRAQQSANVNLSNTKWRQLEIKPTILYNNTSGTTGSITLSETAVNFDYIEVFYGDSSHMLSTRIYTPNGKKTNLAYSYYAGNLVQTQFIEYTISTTTMTRTSTGYFFNCNTQGTSNDIKVFYVLGYR